MGNLAFSVSSVGGSMQAAEKLEWLRSYSRDQDVKSLKPPGSPGTGKGHLPLPDQLSEGIFLENVSFGYGGAGQDVLRDISLLLPAGAIVAVVGENGAGKSTLVKLLLRLYPPSQGRICVDGPDLQAVDPEEWRARTSAAFQDFARFEFTLQHAVGVGSLEELDDGGAVSAALERAGGGDMVDVLPDRLTTQLGRKLGDGVELSGGQWQKVALGRSMMRLAPLLLVLDEPTAALDALSEAALFERYVVAARSTSRNRGGITVLVSHRYSSVRMADLIVVLRAGAVAEVGTHAQLIGAGGPYAELYRLQAAAYE
jgi:ATP-binding cassette subfamily B protein